VLTPFDWHFCSSKLRYECVWCRADSGDLWICFFALDIYNWKDLGSHTSKLALEVSTPGASAAASRSVVVTFLAANRRTGNLVHLSDKTPRE
jgi:hypothetical protein